MNIILRLGILPIVFLLLSSFSARAAVIVGSLDNITGINWLEFGGVYYDVQFVDTSGSSALNGAYDDVASSNEANAAFLDVLNSSNVTGVNGNFSQLSWDDGFGIAKSGGYVNLAYSISLDEWRISRVTTMTSFPLQTWTKITLSSTPPPPPVPVPAAIWLFGSGLLGLIAASRRKKT